MKSTLITGLDGSGKSTLLKRLLALNQPDWGFVFVPHIDLSRINSESPLHQFSKFVNILSEEADNKQIPQLKGLALFASMLLFHLLQDEELKEEKSRLFFERHPLVDTLVYAQFYAEKLHPAGVDKAILADLDSRFETELGYLLYLADAEAEDGQTMSAALLAFIYEAFHANPIEDLAGLFCIELPDEIYFLEAESELLYSRIAERPVKEAHESVAVFELLAKAYEEILRSLENKGKIRISRINANETAQLDALYEHLANG
ncbi:MAG: hypothetical protein AAFN10_04490 [Bacteroidota bacterium]